VKPEDREVDGNEEQARGSQRGADAEDAEIPHFCRVDVDDARGALRERESHEHAERRDDAIGRNHDASDVEENGVH
jgi:hypothetical protein